MKPVIYNDKNCFLLSGNLIKEWTGIREVCNFLKIDRSNMNRHLNGKVHTLKNSKFLTIKTK